MVKIKLALEIEISEIDYLIKDYHVDNIQELAVVMKSEAKQDAVEFISYWSAPVTCTNLSISEQ